jgi:hypothetical protein
MEAAGPRDRFDSNLLQRLRLVDFEHLYRPPPVRSLRRRVIEFDGLDKLLERTHPGDPIRESVVQRLRYESFLEIAAQAGVIPRRLPHDEDTLGDLFGHLHRSDVIGRMLPLLYAARASGRYDYTFASNEEENAARMFLAFECLDLTVPDDADLENFAASIAVPEFEADEMFLAAFCNSEKFLATLSSSVPESIGFPPILNYTLIRIPSGASAPLRKLLGTYHSRRIGRPEHTAAGLRKFILFCLELARVVSDDQWCREFRAAAWYYYASWFGQFNSTAVGGFFRALTLAREALERLKQWKENEADILCEWQEYSKAVEKLFRYDVELPKEWGAPVSLQVSPQD